MRFVLRFCFESADFDCRTHGQPRLDSFHGFADFSRHQEAYVEIKLPWYNTQKLTESLIDNGVHIAFE